MVRVDAWGPTLENLGPKILIKSEVSWLQRK